MSGGQSCLGMNVRGDTFSRGTAMPPTPVISYLAHRRCHGKIGTPNNWHPHSKYPRILGMPIPNFLRDFWHPLGFSVPLVFEATKVE